MRERARAIITSEPEFLNANARPQPAGIRHLEREHAMHLEEDRRMLLRALSRRGDFEIRRGTPSPLSSTANSRCASPVPW